MSDDTLLAIVTQVIGFGGLYIKLKFDERRREKERQWDREDTERAKAERGHMMQQLNTNTAISAKALEQAAKAAGTPIHEAIEETHKELDRLLTKYVGDVSVNEPGRGGPNVSISRDRNRDNRDSEQT